MATVAVSRCLGNSIAPSAYPDPGRRAGVLEGIVAKLELAPEGRVRAASALGQVLLAHTERENMDVEAFLAAVQRCCHQAPDLVYHRVRHGEAADRGAAAVHHDERAGAALCAVNGVGKAQIEGAMP